MDVWGLLVFRQGPRLASVDSKQSALLNAALGSLLGGEVQLSLADAEALAAGQINLGELLAELQADLVLASVEEALAAEITLGELFQAVVDVNQDSALDIAFGELIAASLPLTGTIRLGDLLQIQSDAGAVSQIDLNALEVVVGIVQLFNHEHALTTPIPIAISGATLGVPGLLNVSLQAQVVEPPVIVCGSDGTRFYAAAIRLALALDLVDLSDDTAINIGTLLPLLQVEAVIGSLDLYADIARSEGVIQFVDAVAQAVTVEATPGLVDLYLGHFDPADFFDRNTPLSANDLEHGTVGSVDLSVLGLLNLNVGIEVKAVAEGEATTPTILNFTGPYPQTLTATTGTAVIDDLLSELLTSLGNGGVRLSSSLPPLINGALNNILSFILTNLLTPLFANDGLLDTVLSEVVDPLLAGLGIGIGKMDVTVLGVTELCPDLSITKYHDGIFTAGMTEQYTITVSNQGDYTATWPITVIDTLPTGFSYDSYSGDGWLLDGSPGETVTFVYTSTLGVDTALPTLHLTVAVASTLTGTVTNTVTVATTGDYNTSNNSAFDPTQIIDLDPDDDDDGVLDVDDPAPADPCIPNENALACPTGDTDNDGTLNGDDPAPTDPCVPDANALACPTGDADGDGVSNSEDPAPTDPCIPDSNAVACPSGDSDNDGTLNGDDPAPTDPCVPDANALACPTGDADGDGTPNGEDPAPTDPCVPDPNSVACPTPTPTVTPTSPTSPLPTPTLPPDVPDVAVYVLQDSDYTTTLSDSEKQTLWANGLPVPDIQPAPILTLTQKSYGKPGLLAPIPRPLAQTTNSWIPIFSEDFANELSDGQYDQCNLRLLAADLNPGDGQQDYGWGRNTYHAANGHESAAWPFAGGNDGSLLNPGMQTYPESQRTQIICEFSNLSGLQLKNVMAEFALWMDQGDPFVDSENRGDYFFVGFNTGETSFYGATWYNTRDQDGNPVWKDYRFFYPDLAPKIEANDGKLSIMWSFTSDPNRIDTALGAWLDSLNVERYTQPVSNLNCEEKNPTIEVLGVPTMPDNGRVSKGLNLPPYAVDYSNRAGQTGRLLESNVDWVRLEFLAQPSMFSLLDIEPISSFTSIDLKQYDTIIDDLCDHDIAVLGLLSYQIVLDRSWEGPGIITPNYLQAYQNRVTLLTSYFDDRIRYWEVWNEPDFSDTQLQPAEYAKLLHETQQTIKNLHLTDQVVFGGLGGTDSTAWNYFDNIALAVTDLSIFPGPYDVFAVHPYPSGQWRDSTSGEVLVNPYDYMYQEFPTVLVDFFDTMRSMGNENAPVWITEIGWNRAAESSRQSTLDCLRVKETMVDRYQQAEYLAAAFDVLFTDVLWSPDHAGVTKVFWYQYHDVAINVPESDCTGNSPATASLPASWPATLWSQLTLEQAAVNVDWWFGLYSGTDPAQGITEPQPNILVQCIFTKYPNFNTNPLDLRELDVMEECLPSNMYLPRLDK